MWRQRLLLVAVLCIAVLAIVDDAEAGKKKKAGRRRNREQTDADAGWVYGECVATNTEQRCGRGTKTATRGDETKTVDCRVRCPNRCKYTRGEWSECDSDTNTRSRTLTLKKGGAECEQTKTVTRTCTGRLKREATGCKYTKGEWSECGADGMKTRTLTLKRGDRDQCEQTKTDTRRCSAGCKYTKGDWGECVDGQRSMTMTLSPRSDQNTCEATKIITRDCRAKCRYGQWTEFGACSNGVKTKTRPIIDGDERCQNRATKTKPC